MSGGADRGTYTLLVEVSEEATRTVGALGTVTFEAGWYAYTGSALGPGGLARVDRHREVAAGERETRHWHVDYLLGLDSAGVDHVVTSAGLDAECAVAAASDGEPVPRFGASDCDCPTHLVFAESRDRLLAAVEAAHATARDGAGLPRDGHVD